MEKLKNKRIYKKSLKFGKKAKKALDFLKVCAVVLNFFD